jgi:hypothetical protein
LPRDTKNQSERERKQEKSPLFTRYTGKLGSEAVREC